jgi:hypothetical protein
VKTVRYGATVVDFEPVKHAYTVHTAGGVETFELPSVTKILGIIDKSEALTWWAFTKTVEAMVAMNNDGVFFSTAEEATVYLATQKVRPIDLRDQAADRGTNVHEALTMYADDQPPAFHTLAEVERPYHQSLAGWIIESRPEFLTTELPVVSLTHGYAGTFDYLRRCTCGCGGIVLGDAKTSKAIYDSAHLQVAAYEHAYFELTGVRVCHTELLHLRGDGLPGEVERGVGELEDFLAVAALHERLRGVTVRRRQQRRSFV